jgi:tetratricopeptide (TPR) repeat protein
MAIRLNKTTRDLNVGLSTIVEFLRKKGFSIEKNPNMKISDEEYELLIKEFSTNKDLKLESVKIDQKQLPKKEKESVAEEEIFKIEAPMIIPDLKIIGKIPDLDANNRATRPKKKVEDDLSFYESGNDYKAKGEYDKAIENYNKALALYPGDEDYYAERGEAKLLKGDFEGAIADFRKVIEICPSDSWGYYMSAWAEESAKQYDKALDDYNQIIKILPENAYTYYHRAQVLMLMGRTEEAKADFETVVLQNPVVSVEDNDKPFALFYLGRKAEAIDWQNKILKAYPTAERQYDTACLYSVMNEKELALEYLESALKNGFKDFLHIQADKDLDNIRELASDCCRRFKIQINHSL